MNLTIEATDRCKYCHPETCNCPDYQLMLNGDCIASGDFDRVYKVKNIVEQALVKAASDEREECAQIAEEWDESHPMTNYGKCIATDIRTRTQK